MDSPFPAVCLFISLRQPYLKLLCLLGILVLALFQPATAVFAPEPWFDTSGVDLAIVGGSALLSLNPPYEPIKDMIIRLSKEYGVSPTLALRVAKCESSWNRYAVGDRGLSRGLWQINKKYHPFITDEQTFDPEWSTRFAMEKFSEGKAYLWSCYKDIILK